MEVDRGTYTNSRRSSYAGQDMNAPILGVQQFEVVRGKKKNFGSRKHAARKLLKLQEQFQKSMWAQITSNWGTASNLHTGFVYNVVAGVISLPMFAWDLSSLPVAGVLGDFNHYSMPMYQLQKTTATGVYSWQNVSNNINTARPTGDGYYNESGHWLITDSGSTPGRQPYFMHDWSSVKLSIMGATTRTSRVHVDLVEFDNCAVGPCRAYEVYNASPSWVKSINDGPLDAESIGSAGVFWDRFWSKKLNNPIYTPEIPKDEQRHMRVLVRDTIVIGPEVTYNEDTRGRQVQKSYFWKFNEVHNATDPLIVQPFDTINSIGVGAVTQTDAVNTQGHISSCNNFGSYKKSKWVLVYADVANIGFFNSSVNPSFDIVIKNKHTVKN